MARVILAIRDDTMRRYIGALLQRSGHVIRKVSEFDAALTTLDELSYDLLITQIDSKSEDDWRFVLECMKKNAEMRMLFLNGLSVELMCETSKLAKAGATERFEESFHLNLLGGKIPAIAA